MCKKEGNSQITPTPLYRAARMELGWDMQIQAVCLPAPSEAAEQHAASCTHNVTHAECRGLGGSSLVSRSHTRLCVCLCVCVWSWNFPRDTLTRSRLLASVLLSSFSFPFFQHTFVLLSLPLFLFPPSSASQLFPLLLCPMCSDCGECANWRHTERDAADATAVWAPCLLQGPLKKTRLHVSWGTSTQHSEKPATQLKTLRN